jgi:pyridoxine/pyridoxamine 5'-phosphate oxidase|tara:strand:- start:104 stop:658 length:555 start_codon:yes stop_codon:yes gene_type:complete
MKVFQKLDDFLDFGWAQIYRGKADKKSPARHPTFLTSSADGFPKARTLVMRRSDRENNQIEFHTDTTSSKMLDLKKNPLAGIHIWIPKVQLQIQMEVVVEIKVGDITIPYWNNVPTNSRVTYGTIPSPGTVIESPNAYDHAPDQKRFAVLVCHIETIQLLLLGVKHIRANYKKINNWQGEWLSP